MPKYEICIVSREYRYVEIEAANASDAMDTAWGMVADGYTTTTKAQDYDTDIYNEGEISPRFQVRENREELRVSVIDTETGESRADYEYNDLSERAQNLRNANEECAELNAKETA